MQGKVVLLKTFQRLLGLMAAAAFWLGGHCWLGGQGGHCSWGVETTPPNSKIYLESLWRRGYRPLCVGRERPLPAVLLADDCYPTLKGNALLSCWPTGRKYALPPVKIMLLVLQKKREGCCASGSTEMAQPTMVSRVGKPFVGTPRGGIHWEGIYCPRRGAPYGTPSWNCGICMFSKSVWSESVNRLTVCITHDKRS